MLHEYYEDHAHAIEQSGDSPTIITFPEEDPSTTVVPDTDEQDGRNSTGSQSIFVSFHVIQFWLIPMPKRSKDNCAASATPPLMAMAPTSVIIQEPFRLKLRRSEPCPI